VADAGGESREPGCDVLGPGDRPAHDNGVRTRLEGGRELFGRVDPTLRYHSTGIGQPADELEIWPVQEARVRCIACHGCGHKFGAGLECPLSLGLGGNVGHDRYAELRSHETDVFHCRQSAGPLAIRSVDRHDVGPGFDERPRIFENGSYVGAGAISVLGDPDDRDGADAPNRGDDLGSRYAQPNGATNFGGPGDCDQTIDPVEWIAWQRLARNDQASGQRLDGSDPLPH
jgi:hypothetical protein